VSDTRLLYRFYSIPPDSIREKDMGLSTNEKAATGANGSGFLIVTTPGGVAISIIQEVL
jgi:hypothetical protein